MYFVNSLYCLYADILNIAFGPDFIDNIIDRSFISVELELSLKCVSSMSDSVISG